MALTDKQSQRLRTFTTGSQACAERCAQAIAYYTAYSERHGVQAALHLAWQRGFTDALGVMDGDALPPVQEGG